MNVRAAIAGLAVVLLVAAIAVGWFATREHVARVAGVSSRPGSGREDARAAAQQDFALPEVAVSELPYGAPPFAFVVLVTPEGGASRTDVLEPAASGRALLPPVAPGTELAVSVVAGGSRYGCAWEETIGAAGARAPARGGRFYVVVPVRKPAGPVTPRRLYVADSDGWPLAGARVTDDARTWSVTTTEGGYCNAGTAAARIHVEPPPDRPDLAAVDRNVTRWEYVASASFEKCITSDVKLPPATDTSLPADFAQIDLRPADGRPFMRRVAVPVDRVLPAVPLGNYAVRWYAEGAWRQATLEVTAAASRFLPSPVIARPTRVELPGSWQGFTPSLEAVLVLLERSRCSCLLPRSILESGNFELTGGRGYTSRFVVADVEDDGTAVFEGVAPGDYEIVSRSDPYAVSFCVRVDGTSDVLRVDCAPRLRAAQIAGRIEGPSGASWYVQMRGLGREFDVSRSVKCPGDYEFGDLAEGLYSVRAVSSTAFGFSRPGDDSGITPWRNVVVEAGGRVTVDFHVE
jgi:hypothetical protein